MATSSLRTAKRTVRPSSKTPSLLLVLALATGGCSFVFVDGPKPGTAALCTDSFVMPAVDGALATLEGLRTLYVATRPDAFYDGSPISRNAQIAVGTGLIVAFTASAIVGATQVTACRESIADNQDGATRDSREQSLRWQRQRQREQQSPPHAPP
jgi:hypothetical protein